MQRNKQAKDPCKTLVLSGCILVTYVPLRLERSGSVSEVVVPLCNPAIKIGYVIIHIITGIAHHIST